MARVGSRIGKGLKLDVYVPGDDLWLVDEIERWVIAKKNSGIRTSFNFELVRLLKIGLQTVGAEIKAVQKSVDDSGKGSKK